MVLLAALCCLVGPLLFGLVCSAAQSAPQTPGAAAPAGVVREVEAGLAQAVQRFEARDVAGVLALVSEQYRTGPLTKAGIREQLQATYALYDSVKANVRIDEVRMVGEQVWVYSTGEVSGRLRLLGTPMVFLSWERELEVVRREGGTWRLFGYQQ
jgi:hypothetical protein